MEVAQTMAGNESPEVDMHPVIHSYLEGRGRLPSDGLMHISANGAAFLHGSEGFGPTLYYPHGTGSGSGVTIGWGYDLGSKTRGGVVADLVSIGVRRSTAVAVSQAAGLRGAQAISFVNTNHNLLTITTEQGAALFARTISRYEGLVRDAVNVSLNQNQFDALVSIAYNVETAVGPRSSIITRLNVGNYRGAADAFLLYNRSGGRVVEGLNNRRVSERNLFLRPVR